jgi:glycosyltransferase involved in cell wall biosynthesis
MTYNYHPRILWLLRDLDVGGMQKVAVRLINEMDAESIVALLKHGQLDSQVYTHKYYMGLSDKSSRIRRLWDYGRVARRLALLIDKECPDIVLTFGYSMLVLGALSLRLARHRACFVPSVRCSLAELGQQGRPFPDITRWLTQYALRQVDMVIVVSRAIAEEMVSLGIARDRVRVIYNGLDIARIRTLAKEQFSHPWLSDGIPIITTVGRLSRQKNHRLLLKAVSLIRQNERVRLWLIGDGEERARLQDLARTLGLEEDILFWGFQANPYKYVARSAVFVLSSLYEGFPNALIEAMAVGVPVVSTDCPTGPSEIIEHGRTGLLVPVNDTRAMADAILCIMQDQQLARTLVANASRSVERFDFSTTVRMFQEAIVDATMCAEQKGLFND